MVWLGQPPVYKYMAVIYKSFKVRARDRFGKDRGEVLVETGGFFIRPYFEGMVFHNIAAAVKMITDMNCEKVNPITASILSPRIQRAASAVPAFCRNSSR